MGRLLQIAKQYIVKGPSVSEQETRTQAGQSTILNPLLKNPTPENKEKLMRFCQLLDLVSTIDTAEASIEGNVGGISASDLDVPTIKLVEARYLTNISGQLEDIRVLVNEIEKKHPSLES